MRKTQSLGFFLTLVWLLTGTAQDDPFVGFFSGELDDSRYEVTIDRVNATTYDGLLLIDGDRMQLDARRYGERVGGLLRSYSAELRFRAQLQGSALIFEFEDARRIVLWRSSPL